jgi:hypothetical protein
MPTVLVGVGGVGKGTWAALLAAQTPGVTLFATAEDHAGATVRPRLETAKADLARARFINVRSPRWPSARTAPFSELFT